MSIGPDSLRISDSCHVGSVASIFSANGRVHRAAANSIDFNNRGWADPRKNKGHPTGQPAVSYLAKSPRESQHVQFKPSSTFVAAIFIIEM